MSKRQTEIVYDAVPVFDDAPHSEPSPELTFTDEQTNIAEVVRDAIAEGVYLFGTGFLVAWLIRGWVTPSDSDSSSKRKKR